MPRPPDWTLADVVDFELLLAAPDAANADRAHFEHHVGPRLAPGLHANRAAVFHTWLQVQREQGHGPAIGSAFETGRRTAQGVAIALGGLAGAGLAGSLLAPQQGEPVNALLFLVWTVGLQWLLLAALAGGWLMRRIGFDVAPLRRLAGGALAAAGRVWGHLPGEDRLRLRAALARVQERGRMRGGLLTWPTVILTQQAAVAFNAGVLAAMLLVHLPFAELRFGWQSTYDIDARSVHRGLSAAATPWRAVWPGALPTLDDVAGTRYTRGQSAASLPSDAARAWWPFLALSVACYGLLLRLALLWVARRMLQRRLATLAFRDADASALWRRLHGPLIAAGDAIALAADGAPPPRARSAGGDTGCQVLVADELGLASTDETARLRTSIAQRLGWRVDAVAHVRIDDRQSAADAAAQHRADTRRALAVVVPAGRDPIVAIAQCLRALVGDHGGDAVLLLWPDAPPQAAGAAPTVDPERLLLWRRFLAIHRLELGVEAAA